MPLTQDEERRLQMLRDMKRMSELQALRAQTHEAQPELAPESEAFKAGRQMPPLARGALKTAEVLSFGFAPKLLGPNMEQMFRGGTRQFEEDYPKTSFGIDVAGSVPASIAAAPRMATRAAMRGVTREITPAQRILQAGATGATEGAISGAGYSQATTPEGLIKDVIMGGLLGGAGGAGTSTVSNIAGPVIRNVGERASENIAISEAQKRLAQALMRDTPESYGTDFSAYIRDQMQRLGPEGRLYDVGENTRRLADLLATVPGRARTELTENVTARRMGRGERMSVAAQEGLETGGKRLATTVDDLKLQREQNATPLYQQAYTMRVSDPSGTLAQLVQRADELGATKVAKEIAENERLTKGLPGWTLSPDKVSSIDYSVADLDRIKRGLDTLIAKNYDAVKGQYTDFGQSLIGLRNKLKTEVVNLTTDPSSKTSVYGQALEEYAGPSALIDAANSGRSALNRNVSADALKRAFMEMNQSEQEAFRIGLFEAIRDKVGGSSGGRTEMLNLVENFVPREKLQIAFGSPEKFQKFYDTVNAERVMREADVFGRGSPTAGRMFEAGDIDIEPALDIISTGGSPATLATQTARMWNRLQTPESTRNQLARLLMQRGPRAEQDVFELENVVRRLNEQRARRAAVIGGAGGASAASVYQNR